MENPILSGRFTSTGEDKIIQFRAEVDWMWVYNFNNIDAGTDPFKFYWQRGMADGRGFVYTDRTAVSVDTLDAPNGFYPIATEDQEVGGSLAATGITAATEVVLTAQTVQVGDVVRLYNTTENRTLSGIDFSVTAVNAGTSFTIGNINLAGTPDVTSAFTFRKIPYDPVFYPRQRTITYISASGSETVPAGRTRIFTSVTHGYVVGQKVNLNLQGGSTLWGDYAALNNVTGTIVAVNTTVAGNQPANANNFDINVDTTGYGQWVTSTGGVRTWLLDASYPAPNPTTNIVGEDTAHVNSLPVISRPSVTADSVVNEAIMGILLPGGANNPGGDVDDVMYWVAGSSFDVNNE